MQVQFKFICKCLEENVVKCRKPGLVRPVVHRLTCEGCDTKHTLRITIEPKLKSQVHVKHVRIEPSDELLGLLAQEQAFHQEQQLEAQQAVAQAIAPTV